MFPLTQAQQILREKQYRFMVAVGMQGNYPSRISGEIPKTERLVKKRASHTGCRISLGIL
jgi:hypothetical protein